MSGLPLPSPFDLPFMQRALIAGVTVGVFAPMIGTYLVQKRLSLIGDGIGHVAFAGVGFGLLVGVWPVWPALVFAIVGALAVEFLRARRKASGDVALALLIYAGIAAGVVFASLHGGLNANILSYLFGQPLTVTDSEVWLVVLLGAAIAITVWAFRRVLFAIVTDEDWSRVAGLPVDSMNAVLAVVTACAVVASMRIVGILLVAALMVLPVASAQLLARSFRATLGLAVAVGVGSVIGGLLLSWAWDLAPSGAIVLVAGSVFAAVSIGKGFAGSRRREVVRT